MLKSNLFNCVNKDKYPPFKNGLYLEEYFYNKMMKYEIVLKRKYIPVKWTNFQIESWFKNRKQEMQQMLDEWLINNPSLNGYFTVVQYDDGPLLKLPKNTIIYGACSGDIPIPLIYQDVKNTLVSIPKLPFTQKKILCSFVGNITANDVLPNVRQVMKDKFHNNNNFLFCNSGGWTPSVNIDLQKTFVNITRISKFALAPRGYGRSSFRFFECLQLGTIPIYLWNDKEWLPFKNIIDYKKLCISMNISEIDELEKTLIKITEKEYNEMLKYYNEIKYLFELEGMTNEIIKQNIN
jgi:hypothetical protein